MASIDRITEAVQGVLRRWLVIDVSPIEADLVSLTIQQSGATGTSISFVAAWIGEGWPKEVDKALQRSDHSDVLVARHLSPGAKERAKELAISWVDETGAAEIFVDGLDTLGPDLLATTKPFPSGQREPLQSQKHCCAECREPWKQREKRLHCLRVVAFEH